MDFKTDDIVWVNLGKPYGWWPAQVQDREKKVRMSEQIIKDIGDDFKVSEAIDDSTVFVKFFDDDNFEWVDIKEPKRIQTYSCKNKKKFIKAGFKSLEENKKGGLGGTNLRLAQFYKDVELAEVMTDNDADVANILSLYEISENNDEVVEQEVSEEVNTAKPSKKGKAGKAASKDNLKDVEQEVSEEVNTAKTSKKGKSGKAASKDHLKDIRNGGGVSKSSKKRRKKEKSEKAEFKDLLTDIRNGGGVSKSSKRRRKK
eukprot:GFUD01023720.1.p1 GENE.GFUD01023720.1~~GFUD01023720.1.p1  ORF type:complete len:277 (+),score=87.61 GFUD01023720.1:58-831(+)